jgi:hypothetical protein
MAIDVGRRPKNDPRSRFRDKKTPYVAVLLLIVFYGIVMLGLGIAHLAF